MIHVEQDWLLSVLERFQAEGDTDLARWIERFADFCKELVKLKERLHEEYAERWDQANNLVAGIGSREQALAEQQDAFATAKAAFDHAKAALKTNRPNWRVRNQNCWMPSAHLICVKPTLRRVLSSRMNKPYASLRSVNSNLSSSKKAFCKACRMKNASLMPNWHKLPDGWLRSNITAPKKNLSA